jgi:AcrR family transcriptional regulator
MDLETIWPRDSIRYALCECILEHGVQHVTMPMVARRAGISRATLYRLHPGWNELVRDVHARVARALDDRWPRRGDNRRLEFEEWWLLLARFFRTGFGRAFLQMRPHVATRFGMHEVEYYELGYLRRFVEWAGSQQVARAVWAVVLAAACPRLNQSDRAAMRELAWSIANSAVGLYLGPGADDEEVELELEHTRPLATPILDGGFIVMRSVSHDAGALGSRERDGPLAPDGSVMQ